jgi:hypothetical protein
MNQSKTPDTTHLKMVELVAAVDPGTRTEIQVPGGVDIVLSGRPVVARAETTDGVSVVVKDL